MPPKLALMEDLGLIAATLTPQSCLGTSGTHNRLIAR